MSSTLKRLHAAAPADNEPIGEGARKPRARALLIASIASLDNSQSTPCLVNNISTTGARVTLSASLPLAAQFKLFIPQRNLTCIARVVWRRGDQVGVEFQREAEPPPASEEDKGERIRVLEAENAGLRAEIGVLKYTLYRNEEV